MDLLFICQLCDLGLKIYVIFFFNSIPTTRNNSVVIGFLRATAWQLSTQVARGQWICLSPSHGF